MKKFLSFIIAISMLATLSTTTMALDTLSDSQYDYSRIVVSCDAATGVVTYHSMSESIDNYRAQNNIDPSTPLTAPPSIPSVASEDNYYIQDPTENDDDITSKGITDDRKKVTSTTAFPYCAIAYITYSLDGYSCAGTGFMIDNQCLLTAAHNLYSRTTGNWATNIKVYPGRNGTAGTVYTYKTTWVSGNYTSSSNPDYSDDWGMIELSKAASVGYFGLKDGAKAKSSYILTGYPGEKGSSPTSVTMWTETKTVSTVASWSFYSAHWATSGQSGSPVYTSDYYAVGVAASMMPGLWTTSTRLVQSTVTWLAANKY